MRGGGEEDEHATRQDYDALRNGCLCRDLEPAACLPRSSRALSAPGSSRSLALSADPLSIMLLGTMVVALVAGVMLGIFAMGDF